MLSEVTAAVEHIFSLAHRTGSSLNWNEDVSRTFKGTLHTALCRRYTANWHAEEPERGSAIRALQWYPGGAGDDRDECIKVACQAAAQAAGQAGIVTEATVLPVSFTIWIDPNCVSIRQEASGSMPFARPTGTFAIIWGSRPQATGVKAIRRPSEIDTSLAHSERASFTARSAASSNFFAPSLVPDLSSTGSLTSGSSSGNSDDDACSSLDAFSDISAEDEKDLVDCANSMGLLNFMSGDESMDFGDTTIVPLQTTPAKPSVATRADPTPCGTSAVAMDRSASAPAPAAKPHAVQIYDKGNVSVMSGGVKLGMAKPMKKQPSTSALRARVDAPSNLPAPQLPLPFSMQRVLSAPNHAVQVTSSSVPSDDFFKATAAAFSSKDGLVGLPSTRVVSASGWQDAQQQLLNQSDDGSDSSKDSRSRGKRARGRGGGRALRRQQAAAIKALTEGENEIGMPLNPAAFPYVHGRQNSSSSFVSANSSQTSLSPSSSGHGAVQQPYPTHLESLARQHLVQQQQRMRPQSHYSQTQTATRPGPFGAVQPTNGVFHQPPQNPARKHMQPQYPASESFDFYAPACSDPITTFAPSHSFHPQTWNPYHPIQQQQQHLQQLQHFSPSAYPPIHHPVLVNQATPRPHTVQTFN